MGSSLCSCNNRQENLEYNVTDDKNKIIKLEQCRSGRKMTDHEGPIAFKTKSKNKFSPLEVAKLNEIYMSNLIKRIQKCFRAANNLKEISTSINNKDFYSTLKHAKTMNISKIYKKDNSTPMKMNLTNMIDESSFMMLNKSEIGGISEITNLVNNLTSPSEEKIKFNLQDESEVDFFLGVKVKGVREGFWHLIWRDGGEFKGFFKKGKANGICYLNSSEGDVFCGQFTNDLISGFGVSKHKNGANYIGAWDEACQNGIGVEICADSSNYAGEYFKGKKHGLGTYKWADGSRYHGCWSNNSINGYGIYHFSDGKYYIGQWKNNTMDGYGEFYWTDGKKYAGFYINDKKEGFGIYYWPGTNRIFVGFWRNGKQEGMGKLTYVDKVKYGFWKEGKKVKAYKDEIEAYNSFTDKINIPFKVYLNMSYQDLFKKFVN